MKIWVNADDFGFTKSCTDAIFECFKLGLITTTTACSNGEYFEYGVNLVKNTDYKTKIGLHINLTEGKPLSTSIKSNRKFCNKNGEFIGFPHRYRKLSKTDKEDLYLEIKSQFEKYFDSGLEINHVDSHHHIHNSFRVLPIVKKIAKEYGVSKIRIASNFPKRNLIKRIYKFFINKSLKRFKYTDFMCSYSEYMLFNNEKKLLEVMTHPDYQNNIIVDRINADYNNPIGEQLTFDKNKLIK